MKLESFIRLLAGSFIVASVLLTYLVSPAWLLLTLFVGVNLIQSAFTGFCLPSLLLRKLGWVDANNLIHWGGATSAIHRQA